MEVRNGDSTSTSRAFLSFHFHCRRACGSVDPFFAERQTNRGGKVYTFFASRDEIVAKAKKEGQLRVLYGVYPATYKGFAETFAKKYPFLTVQRAEEITGGHALHRTGGGKNCRFLRR
jgi:hypothetical protein